jgi:hypothetical protein
MDKKVKSILEFYSSQSKLKDEYASYSETL